MVLNSLCCLFSVFCPAVQELTRYFILLSLGEICSSKLGVGKLTYYRKITFFYLEGFLRSFEDQVLLGNSLKFIKFTRGSNIC